MSNIKLNRCVSLSTDFLPTGKKSTSGTSPKLYFSYPYKTVYFTQDYPPKKGSTYTCSRDSTKRRPSRGLTRLMSKTLPGSPS